MNNNYNSFGFEIIENFNMKKKKRCLKSYLINV